MPKNRGAPAAASPARAAGRQLASKVLARATSIVLPVVLGPVALPADGRWPGLCGLSGAIPPLDPIRDALRPAMRYVRESKASLEASSSVFTRAAPFVLGVLCLVTVAYTTAYVTAVAWSLVTSIASVLVSLTTLAALAALPPSPFAPLQLEVLGSSGGTSPSTTRPASTSSRPGPSPARYMAGCRCIAGWSPRRL